MSLVVAIDVGVRNLGICVYNLMTNQVTHWANTNLCTGRYVPANNVRYVRDFVARHQHIFEEAAVVLIERQMRTNMRIIEAVLHSLFYARCTVLSPRVIKQHYGLCTRNYRANKQKAVEWANNFLENNPGVFTIACAELYKTNKKRDDLADALLVLMYYLDTYSNQLTGDATNDLVLDGLLQG